MGSAHDLGTAPRLVDAQVGDDVGSLHATISADAREQRAATSVRVADWRSRLAGNPPGVMVPQVGVVRVTPDRTQLPSMICVVRRASEEIVPEKPPPNCAV